MKTSLILLAAAMLFGSAHAAPVDAQADEAPANSYVVVFKNEADRTKQIAQVQRAMERENAREGPGGIQSKIVYQYDMDEFKGFAGTLNAALVNELKSDPNVRLVEPDGVVHAVAQQNNPPSWGLPRISQRNRDLTKPYIYPDTAGHNTNVYVIDTGIQLEHPDFERRAKWGVTTCSGCPNKDDNGHGTHVAGTIGGKNFGVAKKATLIAVKVLNGQGSGTYSGVIAGINWVANQAKALRKTVVANMSLGGGKSQAVNDAVTAAYKAGVSMAVAAGNENQNACNVSPASTPEAITVAASTRTDARASFSNWGSCVDVFGPGQDITSAWNNGGQRTISGTSMASPHIAGGAALLLGANGKMTPAQITARMVSNATPNKISDVKGSPNKLLFTL